MTEEQEKKKKKFVKQISKAMSKGELDQLSSEKMVETITVADKKAKEKTEAMKARADKVYKRLIRDTGEGEYKDTGQE